MRKTKHNATFESHPFFDREFLERVEPALGHPQVAPMQGPSAPPGHALQHAGWLREHQHAHPFPEVLVVVRGEYLFGIGEKVFLCPPGSLAVILPKQPHVNRYQPCEDGLRHLWVSFVTPEQAFLQFVEVRRGCVRRLHSGRSLMPVAALSRILRSLDALPDDAAYPAFALRRRILLSAFYAGLMDGLLEATSHPPAGIDREALVQRKIAMICEHIASAETLRPSLAELAQLAGYSPTHFARVFKQTTGQTVHQHLNARRIVRARDLLATGVPQKAMAETLGFADKSTLSRWINRYRRAIVD